MVQFDQTSEEALLSILINNPELGYNLQDIKEQMFSSESNGFLFSIIQEIIHSGNVPEISLILTQLKSKGKVGDKDYLNYISKQTANKDNLLEYEKNIVESWKAKNLVMISTSIQRDVLSGQDVNIAISSLRSKLDDLTKISGGSTTQILYGILTEAVESIKNRVLNPGIKGTTSGLNSIDKPTYGMCGGKVWIVAGRPSMGKAQPLYSKVLTPAGWKTMGDINVGDLVIGSDGKSCKVLGTFPQGIRPTYRVYFDDFSTVDCDEEHLWSVETRRSRKNTKKEVRSDSCIDVMTTKQLIEERIILPGNRKNYSIRYVKPVEFGGTKLPLHPYILGSLLGDGTFRKERIEITSDDPEIVEKIRRLLPEEDTIQETGKNIQFVIRSKINRKRSYTRSIIENLNLYMKNSSTKFIPSIYLYNSIENRKELLAGLLDTDGWVEKIRTTDKSRSNFIRYCSVSKDLAYSVLELAQSLGARATITEKQGKYKSNNLVYTTKLTYIVTLSFNDFNPFFLERKRKLFTGYRRGSGKFITRIEKIADTECKCILVDNKDHTYVTDNYTVTHNSASIANFALSQGELGIPNLIFSLEMSKQDISERLVAIRSGVDLTNIKLGLLTTEHMQRIEQAYEEVKSYPIYIDDNFATSINYILATTRKYVRTYGVKVIYIDYLQLLAERSADATNELGRISRSLKLLARELDICVIALSQLNRNLEMRDDKRPIMSDLRASGNLEEDTDIAIGLYRDDVYNKDSKTKGMIEFIIMKNRDGAIGMLPLGFSPATCRLKEWS